MAEIDLERWGRTLIELRDIRFTLRGANLQNGEAQKAALDAAARRDRCAADRVSLEHRNPDIAHVAADRLATAERELTVAQEEMARVQSRVSGVARRFAAQSNLVQSCTRWAAEHGVVLPDADSLSARGTLLPGSTRGIDYAFTQGVEIEGSLLPALAPAASAGPAEAPAGNGLFGHIAARLRDALGGPP